MILIQNLDAVYRPEAPEQKELMDLVLAGSEVVAIVPSDGEESDAFCSLPTSCVEVIDGTGLTCVPGIVDIHLHLAGGGGERGPESRTREAELTELVDAGITTAVGVLGTDNVSRSLQSLLTKVLALNRQGLTCYMYTGSYAATPPDTLFGRSVTADISLLPPVVGLGELALSDHRGSQPTSEQLRQLIADCRRGGLLKGFGGVVYCHIGSYDHPQHGLLNPLRQALAQTPLPATSVLPCHCGHRGPALLADAVRWMSPTGDDAYADFTADLTDPALFVNKLDRALLRSRCVVSSDGYGSCPEFDAKGRVTAYRTTSPRGCLRLLQRLCGPDFNVPLQDVLPTMTSTAADALKLPPTCGRVAVGGPANLLLLDSKTLQLKFVIAKGTVLKRPDQ